MNHSTTLMSMYEKAHVRHQKMMNELDWYGVFEPMVAVDMDIAALYKCFEPVKKFKQKHGVTFAGESVFADELSNYSADKLSS